MESERSVDLRQAPSQQTGAPYDILVQDESCHPRRIFEVDAQIDPKLRNVQLRQLFVRPLEVRNDATQFSNPHF